jgi:hypothetical protein
LVRCDVQDILLNKKARERIIATACYSLHKEADTKRHGYIMVKTIFLKVTQ